MPNKSPEQLLREQQERERKKARSISNTTLTSGLPGINPNNPGSGQLRKDVLDTSKLSQTPQGTYKPNIIGSGFEDFGGKYLAPTERNLSLLSTSMTGGDSGGKGFVLGNETSEISNRIRKRSAQIQSRVYSTPGRRQSLLQDVMSMIQPKRSGDNGQ